MTRLRRIRLSSQERRRIARPAGSSFRRAGFTLFELMAVFAMLAAFLATAIALLALLLRVETTGYEAVNSQLTLARLSRQLRVDAHAARSATAAAEPAGAVALDGAGEATIVWSANADTVQRIVQRNDAKTARDSFRIPESAMQISIADGGTYIELHGRRPRSRLVNVPDVASDEHLQEFVIQAAVGVSAEVAAQPTDVTSDTDEQAR